MSLAKCIIYGGLDEIRTCINQGAEINQIDEYGYNPLVQAAIVNDVEKAKLLLEHGAEIDFADLSGRTALHWAADNNNLALASLLLKKGADPNAYTRAGLPVLGMPFLRNYGQMKDLLYRHNASLEFVQDFINTKLLGHRFDLTGRVDLVDPQGRFFEIEFEGFYFEFSLAMIISNLIDFRNNYGGKHLRPFFDKLNIIIAALSNGEQLLKYQHYLIDKHEHNDNIEKLLHIRPLFLPIAYEGHAISLIRYGNWLVRCDRGEYGRQHGTVIIYKIQNTQHFTRKLCKNLLYKRQYKHIIDDGLGAYLELQTKYTLPLSHQISGNCSWANLEATIPALMFMLLLDEAMASKVVDIEACKQQAMNFYNDWKEWDKSRALHFCTQSFYDPNTSPARKASKAATLAAILYQECEFGKPTDFAKAEKILDILMQEEYQYILRTYVEIFKNDMTNQQTRYFFEFLEDNAINIESLKK
ncbi:MAG: ankyrin repeat domain-containing protein [Gammaproteobacteria bacterium]